MKALKSTNFQGSNLFNKITKNTKCPLSAIPNPYCQRDPRITKVRLKSVHHQYTTSSSSVNHHLKWSKKVYDCPKGVQADIKHANARWSCSIQNTVLFYFCIFLFLFFLQIFPICLWCYISIFDCLVINIHISEDMITTLRFVFQFRGKTCTLYILKSFLNHFRVWNLKKKIKV